MSTALKPIQTDDIPDLLGEIEKCFFDIPFENSEFQTRAFVIAAQITPGRAYRAIGLRMHSKIEAVKSNLFERRKKKVDIDEKRWKLENDELNQFERRRLEIEVQQLEDGDAWFQKLMNDALRELDVLYAELKKYPRYTREAFEGEEYEHFLQRLDRQLKAPGAMESLVNMQEDLPMFDKLIALAAAKETLKAISQKV